MSKRFTVRIGLAMLAVLVVACDDSSPTSPSALATDAGPSSGGSGTLGALDKPGSGDCENPILRHCHGSDTDENSNEDMFDVVVTLGGQRSESFLAIGNEIFIKEAPGSSPDIELSGIPNPCTTEPDDGDFALQILGTNNRNNFPPILVIEYYGLTFNGARLRYSVGFGPNGTAVWAFPEGIPTSDTDISSNTVSGATVNISARGSAASGCGAREQEITVPWTIELDRRTS